MGPPDSAPALCSGTSRECQPRVVKTGVVGGTAKQIRCGAVNEGAGGTMKDIADGTVEQVVGVIVKSGASGTGKEDVADGTV